jgi:hypothetical protein
MTDGFSPFGYEQKLIKVKASATEEWPAWERANLNSALVSTARWEVWWQIEAWSAQAAEQDLVLGARIQPRWARVVVVVVVVVVVTATFTEQQQIIKLALWAQQNFEPSQAWPLLVGEL